MKKKYRYLIIIFVVILAFCISICFIPINATKFIPVIEKQVAKDLGINIHIERLILRLGPSLKVKTPMMHIMYEDGEKFGQLTNVKFFIPWSSLFKNDVVVKRLYADKFILKVSSDDKYLDSLLTKLNSKDYKERPNIKLKGYSLSYFDVESNKLYKLSGSTLDIAKVVSFENLQLKAIGEFFINDKKYLSYDVSILPNIKMTDVNYNIDIKAFLEQMEELDFYSDVIADLKLYNGINGSTQISGLVNIDNISVLDPARKSPKSFIYLTFLGEKIGVLSNIYATNDKKVYIDGVINNSKKKSVDLKVKTDEINLKDIYPKVKETVETLHGDEKIGGKIILRALEEPVRQIAVNAGLEPSVILEKVKNSPNGVGFDAATEEYVDMKKAGIVDPTKVSRSALQNAVSIASMILTTESIVTDKKEPEACKCNHEGHEDMY